MENSPIPSSHESILNRKYSRLFLLLIPAIMAFFIILIPTLKFQWPLSWDIYFHIHLTKLYLENGFTFWDPLTVAPYGRPIAYPPLFHFFISSLSLIFKADPFQVARYLQPVLGMFLVLSITLVTHRLFGFISGISAGILSIYSLITFNRGFIASPATLSFILIPIIIYFYYQANEDDNWRYLLISGFLSGLVFLTHSLSAFMVIIAVLSFAGSMKFLKRRLNLKFLVIFLLITSFIALLWWGPLYLLYNPEFNVFPGYPLPISIFYLRYLGILPTALATVGGLFLLKKGENKGILILSWALSILLLSRAYYLGLNLIPIRVLELASYPLIIMAGYGLSVSLDIICRKLNQPGKEEVNSTVLSIWNKTRKHFKLIIILFLGVLTLISGLVFADGYTPNLGDNSEGNYIFPPQVHLFFNPLDVVFKFAVIADRYGSLDLVYSREGVMDWFLKKGDRTKVVFSTDSYLDTIIVSTSRVQVIKGGFSENIPSHIRKMDTSNIQNFSREQLLNNNIKYLVLRRGMEIPSYAYPVYINEKYIICVIQ